ncbi:trans-aconitate 2-methyltransferase [Mycobacterium sp. MYCO198283]|uniref:trans-aconitate 2-methyltransferase n=1 Tax=Mycobacterium sp. MYCO198283 TaxID=2883505 RepID=UPI001E53D798|nr:trans-aconitate 2-methyltransferase [Mycobacterium sp. MYCO198283]MCG5432086.1 trans-aconitate 2-methyltransferase [Mycobacterium sp. MYCO198283]
MRWDPTQYGRFAAQRDRPFLDLTARIEADTPRRVVDVGCGQGHLTALLAERWPGAAVEGVDSSPEMIAEAAHLDGVSFALGDARDFVPADDVDVVVSNAVLQWVPRHDELLARWAAALPRGGWLAVQVPGNHDSPSYRVLRELADAHGLRDAVPAVDTVFGPADYARVLLDAGLHADAWETTYVHVLDGPDPVLEWMRGTGLRPLLARLSPDDEREFTAEYAARLRECYPRGEHGTLFAFRRVFAVGHKP